MALFDQLVLPDRVPKIVDLSHTLLDKFFTLLQKLDFAREAQRRGVSPMVLFVGDPDDRARQGYKMLMDRFPDLPLVPVLNEAIGQIEKYGGNFPATRRGGPPVAIPSLSPVLRSVIEKREFSFLAYAAKTMDGTTELYGWIRRTFVTFRELEVRLLLGEMPKLPRADDPGHRQGRQRRQRVRRSERLDFCAGDADDPAQCPSNAISVRTGTSSLR